MHTIGNVDNIVIIAGGPSARGIDFMPFVRSDTYILGCKDAFFNAPCHGCFTMDRRWNMHRVHRLHEQSAQVFASKKHWGFKPPPGHPYLQIAPWSEVEFYKVDIYARGLSLDPAILNGRDSGFAALNLAFHKKPKRIFLFGFDLTMTQCGDEHWYADHEWRAPKRSYPHGVDWAKDHALAAPVFTENGIAVYNASAISIIDAYPRVTTAEALHLMELVP